MKQLRIVMLVLVTLTTVAAGASALFAQPAPQAQASQDEFVPAKTLPAQDQIPAANLVMAAYGFVWALLLVYVWTVWRRLMKVEREMQDLSSRLGQKR